MGKRAIVGMMLAVGISVAFAQTGAGSDRRIQAAEGVMVYFRDVGSGRPIVLLAGGPGFSGDYLRPLAADLSANCRVILPDARGTGRSAVEPFDSGQITIEALVADLERIRALLKFEKWTLLGHSFGGILAMAYAAEHPDRVAGLVLVGSGGITSDFVWDYNAGLTARLTDAEKKEIGKWQNPSGLGGDPERAVVEISRIVAPAMMVDRKLAERLAQETLVPERFNPRVTLALQPWLRSGYDFRKPLKALTVPVIIIQGRQDPIGEATAQLIKNSFKSSDLRLLENCGHWPFLEKRDEFAKLLESFLNQKIRGL